MSNSNLIAVFYSNALTFSNNNTVAELTIAQQFNIQNVDTNQMQINSVYDVDCFEISYGSGTGSG